MDRRERCVLFDWGDTLMVDFPGCRGPMIGWPKLEALPGAAEALAALQPAWTLALATNAADSDEAQIRAALRRVDLERWLDRVYCYRRIGHPKPSAAFFESVLRDLGLTAQHVVMVGDDFAKDVQGARRAGLRAVWLNRRTGERPEGEGVRTILDLGELPDVLENWDR
ncbi:MAG TPA: HAD family hydrolase [Acidobacteriota bacterium]|nr:HAD family hydrolase [Acidobacteriota bacterium]